MGHRQGPRHHHGADSPGQRAGGGDPACGADAPHPQHTIKPRGRPVWACLFTKFSVAKPPVIVYNKRRTIGVPNRKMILCPYWQGRHFRFYLLYRKIFLSFLSETIKISTRSSAALLIRWEIVFSIASSESALSEVSKIIPPGLS